jgi:hypothetical protein
MGPHSDHLYRPDAFQNLVNKAVLNRDSPGVCSGKIADKLLVRWGYLVRILRENMKKSLSFSFQACSSDSCGIFLRLFRVYNSPLSYHPGFSLHFSTGVLSPLRIDSLMPGTERRYRLSWIDRQSSSEIRIALDRFPAIWIGSWDSAAWSRSL